MSRENMLELMKKALLIPANENYADDEINTHIASCRQLLVTAGIPSEIAESDDSLVKALITIGFPEAHGLHRMPRGPRPPSLQIAGHQTEPYRPMAAE